jgi:hypothetical protein
MSEYNLAWSVYLASASVLMIMAYLLFRKLKPFVLVILLQSLVVAVLVTPAVVQGSGNLRVPAFMAALFEFLSGETDIAISRLGSLTAVMLIVFLLALLLRFLWGRISSKTVPE